MAQPLRGTQSLVGQMGWVFARPSLPAIEIAWRWAFGIPFLAVCSLQVLRILLTIGRQELLGSDLTSINPQNPWLAATQISRIIVLCQPFFLAGLRWLLPIAALAWVVVSGIGRGLLLRRMEPTLRFRPLTMIALQTAWLALFAAVCWGWYSSIGWVAATHIPPNGEPDLIGFSGWTIFLSLGFFTAWALLSWPLAIAPLIALFERRSPFSAIKASLHLGRAFTGKLVEINLVMGIVKLALIVVAMVFSAAPLPFSEELGPDSMHAVWMLAVLFFLVASGYFQVVRLKGFVEFWRTYRG
jgi:hypothetical protein